MSALARIITHAVESRTLRKLVLSSRRTAAGVDYDKVIVRPVSVRGEDAYQFSLRQNNAESHQNLSPADTTSRILVWCATSFADCHVFTTEADYSAHIASDGKAVVKSHGATGPRGKSEPPAHNRRKTYLIPEGSPCPFLIEIGVMTSSGNVRASQTKKFRQINRFLELVDHSMAALPAVGKLHVIDFGCGKSSLTFALHHLLTVVHGRSVEIVGMDRNRGIVRKCQKLADKLGLTQQGLSFQPGEIAEFSGFDENAGIDLVVSLHACDTATDDALAQAVRWESSVILAVPCCQHEVAGAMSPTNVAALARHGILKERFAALATDALRAEVLELCGYKTQVVEFIDMEHTPKNVLIRAVRRATAESHNAKRYGEYWQLKQLLGVDRLYLEDALGDAISTPAADSPDSLA